MRKNIRLIFYFGYLVSKCGPRSVFRVFCSKQWFAQKAVQIRRKNLSLSLEKLESAANVIFQIEDDKRLMDKKTCDLLKISMETQPFMVSSTSGSTGVPFQVFKSKYAFLNSQKHFMIFSIPRFLAGSTVTFISVGHVEAI